MQAVMQKRSAGQSHGQGNTQVSSWQGNPAPGSRTLTRAGVLLGQNAYKMKWAALIRHPRSSPSVWKLFLHSADLFRVVPDVCYWRDTIRQAGFFVCFCAFKLTPMCFGLTGSREGKIGNKALELAQMQGCCLFKEHCHQQPNPVFVFNHPGFWVAFCLVGWQWKETRLASISGPCVSEWVKAGLQML